MKIAIFGGGYVGLNSVFLLEKNNHDIDVFDIDKVKISKFNNNISPINDIYIEKYLSENNIFSRINYMHSEEFDNSDKKYDLILISLATNPISGEELNFVPIKELIHKIRNNNNNNNNTPIIVRSTINLNDAIQLEKEGIGYWPEFISQGTDIEKNLAPEAIIYSKGNFDVAKELFKEFDIEILCVSHIEAIMIKIIHNSYDSFLITISNLISNILISNGISYSKIAKIVELMLSKRPKLKNPGLGYGGSCYPKDSRSLMTLIKNSNDRQLLTELDSYNTTRRFMFEQHLELIKNSRKVGVLGISFKGGTNDITESPTLNLVEELSKLDNIIYYEPNISNENYKNRYKLLRGKELFFANGLMELDDCDLIIITSDWQEFHDYNFKNKNVIDYKGFLNEEEASQCNLIYSTKYYQKK